MKSNDTLKFDSSPLFRGKRSSLDDLNRQRSLLRRDLQMFSALPNRQRNIFEPSSVVPFFGYDTERFPGGPSAGTRG